ncbi:hypothetical protein BC827DRAFT_705765 [Russula dissimulans]|nr:hypothetical protein BC827DRAFT_705765 [Russula dissimulans]
MAPIRGRWRHALRAYVQTIPYLRSEGLLRTHSHAGGFRGVEEDSGMSRVIRVAGLFGASISLGTVVSREQVHAASGPSSIILIYIIHPDDSDKIKWMARTWEENFKINKSVTSPHYVQIFLASSASGLQQCRLRHRAQYETIIAPWGSHKVL